VTTTQEATLRLKLTIDNLSHEIDSTDPELLARWIVEILGRLPEIYASTRISLEVLPSFVLVGLDPPRWGPDWPADARVTGQVLVRSPRDVVAALGRQLDELEDVT
jgi:hypothetical protein